MNVLRISLKHFLRLYFEIFRPNLNKALVDADGRKGAYPPFDSVLMFKILVIQTLNNLSDEHAEYLISGLACLHPVLC